MKMQNLIKALVCSAASVILMTTAVPQLFAADGASLYKGKCMACHAADGTGSVVGKKIGVRDFHSPDVQKESDADLTDAIAKGRNKMPAYEKSLQPDEIKALIAYIHTFQK